MKHFILFLKGFLVGFGKIIPGVSGSIIAVSLNIYESSIEAINHLRNDFKKSILFLLPIGLGVIISAMFFSNIVLYFLNHFYLVTMFLFIGLIFGTIPGLKKQVTFQKKSSLFAFVFAFIIPLLIPCFQISSEFQGSMELISFCIIFFLGFLDAATMVIPGISGTAIFMMLGSYTFVMNLMANPLSNIFYTLLFGLGMITGVFLVSWFVALAMKKNRELFLSVVLGLLFSSFFCLIGFVILQVTVSNFLILLLFFLIGYVCSKCFSKQ